jgi:hypothetical protein
MASINLNPQIVKELIEFLQNNKKIGLVGCYLNFLEISYHLKPVLYGREKMIYQSLEDLLQTLEKKQELWRETEIQIQYEEESVNEQTKKIYICPFDGKVFGDNTCPDPQDAIYDWVSSCPENTERVEGLRAKRFFVSEDPEVIKNYIVKRKEPIRKKVFSSAASGKLFNTKEAVIDDFIKKQIKYMSLNEVQNQNKYQIEEKLLNFLTEELKEDKIQAFLEDLSQHEEFEPYLKKWLG